MAGRLDGKVAIITGAGTGIGEAIAHKFALEGARAVLVGLPEDPVPAVAEAVNRTYPGAAVVYLGDISEETHARQAVDLALSQFGQLDILINNAGVFLATAELEEFPVENFDRQLRMNVRSVYLMSKYALPHLKKTRGNIVCAGSEAGFNGVAYNAPYGGTKGFIHSFVAGLAVEQGPNGVRVNCVCPGGIDTAWTDPKTGPMSRNMAKQITQAVPLGRLGTPEEMANVYAFLASDEASYVNGALWLADGGVTVSKGTPGAQAKRDVATEPPGKLALEHSKEGLEHKDTVKLAP